MTESRKVVTPVKTGVQKKSNYLKKLDTGFRRYDDKTVLFDFLRVINNYAIRFLKIIDGMNAIIRADDTPYRLKQ